MGFILDLWDLWDLFWIYGIYGIYLGFMGFICDLLDLWVGVFRPIQQPFKMSQRYTIYIFELRKAWGIQPCVSHKAEISRSVNRYFFVFIFQ